MSTGSKQEWLNRIQQASETWEALVAGADKIGMEAPGVMGQWTFKDVAGHLNGWRRLTIARLEAAAGNQEPPGAPWPDGMTEETDEGTDEINRWFYDQGLEQPVAEVLAESHEQFRRIRAVIEVLSEEKLETRFSWLDGYPLHEVIDGALEHFHVDHEPAIRDWLSRSPT